jgi:hypothetical protein
MSNEYDVFDNCLVDGEETSTKDMLKCISERLRDHPGAQDFSRNVLLVYSAGKHKNVFERQINEPFVGGKVSWLSSIIMFPLTLIPPC